MCVDLTISLLKLSQMNLLVFKGVTHWKVYELNFYIQAISRFSFEVFLCFSHTGPFRPSLRTALAPVADQLFLPSSTARFRNTDLHLVHLDINRLQGIWCSGRLTRWTEVGLLLGGLSGWRGRACGTPVNWPIYLVILLHQSGVFYKDFHFSSRVQLVEKFHIFARQCVIISINFSIECLT